MLYFNNYKWIFLKKKNELDELVKEEAKIKNHTRDLRQKVEEARSSLAMNKSRGTVLEALIQQKKTGQIPGIYGRLVSYS